MPLPNLSLQNIHETVSNLTFRRQPEVQQKIQFPEIKKQRLVWCKSRPGTLSINKLDGTSLIMATLAIGRHQLIQLNNFIMQTMNISLPDQLKEFVDNQVGSGRYSSVSEYIRDRIRDDEKRKTQDKLETLLMEGIRSGDATEMTRQDWDDIRREALKQFQARKSHKMA